MSHEDSIAFFKTVARLVTRERGVDFEEGVEVYDRGYFVRVFKKVRGSSHDDEICYSTHIHIDEPAAGEKTRVVTITARKSFDSDLNEIEEVEAHSPHVYTVAQTVLKDVSRKLLKALHAFFVDPKFRERILELVQLDGASDDEDDDGEDEYETDDTAAAPATASDDEDGDEDGASDEDDEDDDDDDEDDEDEDGASDEDEDEALELDLNDETIRVLRRFVGELPGPEAIERSEVSTGPNDELYLVQYRTTGVETVVYTTNVWYEAHALHMKTWRAFEVVYSDCSNKDDPHNDPFLYNRTTVLAPYRAYRAVVSYAKSRMFREHTRLLVVDDE